MASECTGASSRSKNAAVQRDTSRAEGPADTDNVKTGKVIIRFIQGHSSEVGKSRNTDICGGKKML